MVAQDLIAFVHYKEAQRLSLLRQCQVSLHAGNGLPGDGSQLSTGTQFSGEHFLLCG